MTSRFKTTVAAMALLGALAAAPAFAGDVSGRVTDSAGQVGLEGAIVRIPALGVSASTDREGAYRFRDLPAGEYEATVDYLGAPVQTLSITVGALGTVTADVALGSALPEAERIVVVGQRGALFNALNQKRAAGSLTDVLSSDAIGQFPDENVSESVRRVTGVLVENDQGEGRFVSIRGLNPELNATSLNGVRVPAPESDIRGVALDVIDSEVLEGIVINKSLTPDMDGDAIGGSIDIKTTTAFDRGDDMTASAELGGTFNELTEEVGPKLAATFTNVFADGTLGVALSASFRERTFATENQEVDGAWDVEDGLLWNEEFELRDYVVTRERTNFAANFDYRPNTDHRLYLRTLFSEFADQEFRSRVEVNLEDADIAAVGGLIEADGEIRVDRDMKDRYEVQQIWSAQLGGESVFEAWTFDYAGAFSHAEEEQPSPGALDAVTFRRDFDGDGNVFFDTSGINFDIIRGTLPIDDASEFGEDRVEWENVRSLTEDEELVLEFNARKDFTWGEAAAYFQSGVKYRDREKSNDENVAVYRNGPTLDNFLLAGGRPYPLTDFGPFPDPAAIRNFFNANVGSLSFRGEDSEIASTVADYVAGEEITAAYAMTGIERGPLNVIAGLRYEGTDFSATADQVRIIETPGGGDTELTIETVSINRDYDDFLPSVNVRYELSDDLLLRAAYYRAVSRPTFGGIVPRAEIEDTDEDDGDDVFEGGGGNPDLDHQVAENFDLGLEYYIGKNGILSAGVFHKEIDDYIAEVLLVDVEVFGLDFEEFETFTNLDGASVTGLEIGYQQSLDMLPAPFDGFLVGANATFLDGSADFGGAGTDFAARTIDLPKLSDLLFNFVIGYDQGPIDVRLAYAYRSEYLDEINGGFDDGLDRFVDAHGQWDLTGRYRLTDRVRVYGELKNITDEPFLAFTNVDGRKALLQYEEYGYTANFGVKVNY